jgi:hypothetical protein
MGYGGGGMGYGGMGTSSMMMQRRMQPYGGGGMSGMYGGMNGGMGMNEPLPPAPGGHAAITGSTNGALTAPPPADESPQQRRARRREERRIMKQQSEDRKSQRRTFLINASMELFSHGSQILMHSIRSCYEMLSIAFGAYYSIRAMRQFFEGMQSQQQQQRPAVAVATSSAMTAGAGAAVVSQPASPVSANGGGQSFLMRHAKKIVLFLAAIAVGDLLLNFLKQRQRAREHQQMRAEQHHQIQLIDGTQEDIMEDGDTWSIEYTNDGSHSNANKQSNSSDEEESEDDEEESGDSEEGSQLPRRDDNTISRNSNGGDNNGSSSRRAFIALYDSIPDDGSYGHLVFRQGDQLLVDNYTQDDWCEATIVSANGERRRGIVPGNYIVPITIQQKF